MLKYFLLAEEATASQGSNSWIFLVVIGVLFVGMLLLSYFPNKKRQKQFKEMQSSLKVGDKIMTIGRLIGTVQQINDDNTLLVNFGSDEQPTIVKIDKEAIGMNLTYQAAYAAQQAQAKGQPAPTTTESTDTVDENTNNLSLDKQDDVTVERKIEKKDNNTDDYI